MSRMLDLYNHDFPSFDQWLDDLSVGRQELALMRIERVCEEEGVAGDEGRTYVEGDVYGSMYMGDLMQFWIDHDCIERVIQDDGTETFHAT